MDESASRHPDPGLRILDPRPRMQHSRSRSWTWIPYHGPRMLVRGGLRLAQGSLICVDGSLKFVNGHSEPFHILRTIPDYDKPF